MARTSRAARACTAEGEGDVAQVGDQPRGIRAFAADVEVARVTMRDAAVDDPARPKRIDRRLPQFLNVIEVAGTPFVGELCGGAEADAERRREGARTKTLLLPATMNQRRRLRSFSHPQSTDALRTVDLVR